MIMKTAIGLMSGTSLDGVDAAIIRTDGKHVERTGQFVSVPYPEEFQRDLFRFLGKQEASKACVKQLTEYHKEAVQALLTQANADVSDIDIIGFHGQTLYHDPQQHITVQIGDAQYLANSTGVDVVFNLRNNDVNQGGQGAPLVPVYHHVLAQQWELPVCFLNIGGVANVTYVTEAPEDMLAFDTGPGNALMNDVMLARLGKLFDESGQLAAKGKADMAIVEAVLSRPYFQAYPPKSLDRHMHMAVDVQKLETEDALATLAEITVRSISKALAFFPQTPKQCVVCGGGRKNQFLMQRLGEVIGSGDVLDIDTLQLNGDAIEAEAFAMLAVRSLLGMPLTYPGTTGVKSAATGGDVYRAAA